MLGDDNLIKPNGIEYILKVLSEQPNIPLLYLNYSYALEKDPSKVKNLDQFLANGPPTVISISDIVDSVRNISAVSENFFTSIFCLVFRRDHALRAYSQNTEVRPFSTMLSCIPTSYYVLNYMMEERACWVGTPVITASMNPSWLEYAPLWVIERLPELFDHAEALGVDPLRVHDWRVQNVNRMKFYFKSLLENDTCGNLEFFSPLRLIARHKHLDEFKKIAIQLRSIYKAAHLRGETNTHLSPTKIFTPFD